MSKISVMDAFDVIARDFYFDEEIDLSDLWIIDFLRLHRYEKQELMIICMNKGKRIRYLVNVLHCRYGYKFRYVLEDLFCAYHGIDQFDYVIIHDGSLEVSLVEDSYSVSIPWLKESMCDAPRDLVRFREKVVSIVLSSDPYPTAITKRIYVVKKEEGGVWDEYIEYVSDR